MDVSKQFHEQQELVLKQRRQRLQKYFIIKQVQQVLHASHKISRK